MHLLLVDAIHAIDSRSVEQYSAVKMSLDVKLLVGSSAGIIFENCFRFVRPAKANVHDRRGVVRLKLGARATVRLICNSGLLR